MIGSHRRISSEETIRQKGITTLQSLMRRLSVDTDDEDTRSLKEIVEQPQEST